MDKKILLMMCLSLTACSGLPPGQGPQAPVSEIEGEVVFEKVEKPTPQSALRSLLDQAIARAEAGQVDEGVAMAERALRLEPRNPRIWLALAELYLEQGEFDKAQTYANRAVQLAREETALQAQAWRLIERSHLLIGNMAAARSAAAQAQALERKD